MNKKESRMDGRNNERKAFRTCREKKKLIAKKIKQEEVVENEKRKKNYYTQREKQSLLCTLHVV